MSNDLKIIEQIEKKLSIKLERLDSDKEFFYGKQAYVVDQGQNVTGLALYKRKLTDYSFLRDLKSLT